MRWITIVFMAGILGLPVNGPVEAQTAVSEAPGKEYDTRFFQAIQRIFETFNEGDLQRVFQTAQPVGCSDLLGDWRTAAFFNENRNLERWYYKTFEEVQADLSRYIFQGQCGSESATVEVVSRFPVRQSMDAYNKREIEFDRIAFKVNAPVKATFDSRTRAYTFELPYLYVTGRNGASNTYSMMPPDAAAKYAQEVTNRWDCKAVKDTDTTYRFLLCRTGILPRNPSLRSQTDAARGASAYVLLTDGREARATSTLSFPTSGSPVRRSVAAMSRIAELGREDFRLRFVNRSWEFRIASPALLAAGQLSAVDSTTAVKGDHCEWRPQSPATAVLVDESDKTVQYYMTRADRSASSPASFTFDARTDANFRLGILRCVFPGTESAAGIEMNRLLSVFSDHINIEFR